MPPTPEIQAMLVRHYRDEWGNCGHCSVGRSDESTPEEWPCDAAVLLQAQGYTLREDPLYVPPPRQPGDPDFIADIWSAEVFALASQGSAVIDLVNRTYERDLAQLGDTIRIEKPEARP